jgi:hypothetical protein
MEEWRVLAHRVVESNLVSFVSGAKAAVFHRILDAAIMKLATHAYIARRIRMGATRLEINAIPMPPPDGYSPRYLIDRARVEFEALMRGHAMAGHIVSLYGARRSLPLRWWQTWKRHHATAVHNAEEVMWRLHNAAASCEAVGDAIAMARSLPHQSPAWVAWSSEAESLVRNTHSVLTTARNMALLMRDAVILEHVAACNVLNG